LVEDLCGGQNFGFGSKAPAVSDYDKLDLVMEEQNNGLLGDTSKAGV
jgi:hypothetical protein